MNIYDIAQILLFYAVLICISPFLGFYMANIFTGKNKIINKFFKPAENLIYKIGGIKQDQEMNWKEYLFSIIIFNFFGFVFLFLILTLQENLPLNPQKIKGMPFDLAFNTAVSFVTNTNWQSYSGESSLSYFSQMTGLTVQNFLSSATGITVFLALTRGIISKSSVKLGNFWIDLTRCIIYILLPLSIILGIILISQGTVQSLSNYITITTIENNSQIIPLGPAASQIAIKQLGTNGGGFFGVNSSHPFENPTPVSNFLQLISILLIPSALVFTYGKLIKSKKESLIIYTAMILLFTLGLGLSLYSEFSNNPLTGTKGFWEGKEVRHGITNSVLWSVSTTAASNGSVNSTHSSLSPLSGFIAVLNIMLGEIIFGGVGSGLYGMFMFIILTVFISGLMVGRTPEYLGKKIEKKEIQMIMLAIIAPSFIILVFSGLSLFFKPGLSGILNKGPHGLSEVLYAFSSAAGNNGSAFAGLNTNTVYYNILTAIGMLAGRYLIIISALAIAGSLSTKKSVPQSEGTLKTDSIIFLFMLVSVILIIGALTFFPVLTLGPILEHILMNNNIIF